MVSLVNFKYLPDKPNFTGSKSDNVTQQHVINFMFQDTFKYMQFYSRDGFRPIFLYWPYKSPSVAIQITERGSNFNDMQPRFMLANQGIKKIPGAGK